MLEDMLHLTDCSSRFTVSGKKIVGAKLFRLHQYFSRVNNRRDSIKQHTRAQSDL
jgi:hypothetical protein